LFVKSGTNIGKAVSLNPSLLALATNFATGRFNPDLNVIRSRPFWAIRAKMPDVSVLSLPVPETIRTRLIERNHNFSTLKISDVAKFFGYSAFRCHVEVSILHDPSSDSLLGYNIFPADGWALAW
jgi:hypothetical protein